MTRWGLLSNFAVKHGQPSLNPEGVCCRSHSGRNCSRIRFSRPACKSTEQSFAPVKTVDRPESAIRACCGRPSQCSRIVGPEEARGHPRRVSPGESAEESASRSLTSSIPRPDTAGCKQGRLRAAQGNPVQDRPPSDAAPVPVQAPANPANPDPRRRSDGVLVRSAEA